MTRFVVRFCLLLVSIATVHASAPETVLLWDGVAPGSEGQTGDEIVRLSDTGEHIVSNVHRPSLTVYLPETAATPTLAVLIIPGGGHREIWTDHEGHNVAHWLNAHGIAGFMLKYRLPEQAGSPYKLQHEVADAVRAVRVLRQNAERWHIDPVRIGVIGFSAGGELAARVALAADAGNPKAADPVERQSSRVAFQALLYPAHPEIIEPTKNAPPAFLCWGFRDFPMIADGMGSVYSRFRAAEVPVEMHVYADAGHGFGIRPRDTTPAGNWIDRFYEWLDARGLLKHADAIVSADGSGTHATIQAAIDAAPTGATKPYVIRIKPGTYREHVVVPDDKPFLTFRGDPDQAAATIVTLGTNINSLGADGRKLPTPDSATVLIHGADFKAENITFENTTKLEEHVQALAFYITGDRAVLRDCRFVGWQDTLRPDSPRPPNTEPDVPRPTATSRQYFVNCYIAGHVDFIYAAGTAVFDHCHVHVRGDGWITAASTPPNAPFGFVFLDCRVTAAPEVKRTYLGRPWRDYAAVAFLRCELPDALDPAGWHNWDRARAEKTVRYAEYKNTGPGARPESRVPWARQLSDDEAKTYTVENILGRDDHWRPAER